MNIEFKYQTLFTCTVPDGFTAIKNFNELVSSDEQPSEEFLTNTIRISFEHSGINIMEMSISNDLNHCDILIENQTLPIRVIIRTRPSLVVDGQIFKLEELDI